MVLILAASGALGALFVGLAVWRRSVGLLLAGGFFLCGAAGFAVTTLAFLA